MGRKNKPRRGSLAYYPRKRAARETPSWSTFAEIKGAVRPLSFLAYKAGMVHGIGRDAYDKSTSYGQEIFVPLTVLECPPLKVFGIRAYEKTTYGLRVLTEITIDKIEKHFRKKMKSFKKKSSKKKKEEKKYKTVEDLEKMKDKIVELRLLVYTQPSLTDFGKKKPDVTEIAMNGTVEEQLKYSKERIGKEIKASEIFKEKQFIDVKAVDKGKGYTGVIKRFNVKIQRPKAKFMRSGSHGPWHPPVLMWTVPMAGQMGYQTRTELNKRLVKVGTNIEEVNLDGGFMNYGTVKNEYLLVAGSIPGPAKRAIAIRDAVRPVPESSYNVADVKVIKPFAKSEVEGKTRGKKKAA